MALDFTGIYNEEFYSSHYLEAVLEGDLKAVYRSWVDREKAGEGGQPHRRLAGLSNAFFEAQKQAEGEPDAQDRWRPARAFHTQLLERLGYEYRPCMEDLNGDEQLPVLVSLERDGKPFLWIVDAPFSRREDDDALGESPLRCQVSSDDRVALPRGTWREILDSLVFQLEDPPRWVLFLAGSESYLAERSKWPQGKYIRFDWGELLGRSETNALKAAVGLLHKDVIAPDAGLCLHDTLDENSHKHAHAVSADLRYGVRRAVEILANEAVYYRRHVSKREVFQTDSQELADKLKADGLMFLYRLLFIFYVEARSDELGVVPMKSVAYRTGYSLESLRDLELVPLNTEHARAGYFLHDSLRVLFRILNEGFATDDAEEGVLAFVAPFQAAMKLDALQSPLFDDDRLMVMKGVRFRNEPMQEVLRLLSLSATKQKARRGRISYASLGINQLGSVYEGLLSYSGFFAGEDLCEVAAEKDCKKISGKGEAEREVAAHRGKVTTHFVPAARIDEYRDGEVVRDANEKRVVHRKGSFIFRLAGHNREHSASYYTPEVLTKCLVKYSLKELLGAPGGDDASRARGKTAEEILALTVCEPAMGSSAFLIEAVDQLADAYLGARQEELGVQIPSEEYQGEKRRVMARLATNNCYGVDLNPTAVELAKTSLWLATMYEGGKCPWFGLRLAAGNSLVGARREVFRTSDVTRKSTKGTPNWLGLVPEAVPLSHGDDGSSVDEDWVAPRRPSGTVYHFLLPAEGMVAFDRDKVVSQLAGAEVARIKQWRKEFFRPFSVSDARRLEALSDAVDRLFTHVVRERVMATGETSDLIPVWGEQQSARRADLEVRDQEELAAALRDGGSASRRLRVAMDAWCALWFWPMSEAGLLPDREQWLGSLERVLIGKVTPDTLWRREDLFADFLPASSPAPTQSQGRGSAGKQLHRDGTDRLSRLRALSESFGRRRAAYVDECGVADLDEVVNDDPMLGVVQSVARRLRFHHWPLRFAEVFARSGGFDLVLGNPPWIKLEWDEVQLLADMDPALAVRSASLTKVVAARSDLLDSSSNRAVYVRAFEERIGQQSFLSSAHNYPLLAGQQTNLFKCFVSASWTLGSRSGVAAFLHPDGVYEDPKGAVLRRGIYRRLRCHYQFINELRLFSEVHNLTKFSVNVYAASEGVSVGFLHASNLLHPRTLDESVSHDGFGPVPGTKDETGAWDFRPHARRIVRLDLEALGLFASLFDAPGTPPLDARLPVLHSKEVLGGLERLASAPRLGLPGERWGTTREWHEGDRQRDGTLRREVKWPDALEEWIVSGPHIFVGNPMYKTPNANCANNRDYSAVDLSAITADFLPRTNYVRDCDPLTYGQRLPQWAGRSQFSYYRVASRKMLSPTGERTFIPAIIPAGAPTTGGLLAAAFSDPEDLARFAGLGASVVLDFLVKSMGKANLNPNELAQLPALKEGWPEIVARALRLNCLGDYFSSLWESCFSSDFCRDQFVSEDARLGSWSGLSASWGKHCSLSGDLERRHALLELDVLSAMALGLSMAELLTIYRAQFSILIQYERERMYDQHGRAVPAAKTVAGKPAVSLIDLAVVLKEQVGFDVHAEYHPDGSNTQELRAQEVRLGKKEAGVLGVPERCTMADLLAETDVRWRDASHPDGRPVRLVGLRYTDPGLEPHTERVYPTPWTRCDREADYRQAWAAFERRLRTKRAGG